MKKPTVGSLFSGIGGIDLGLQRAGFVVKWQVEKDEFARRVLKKHWPNVRRYKDVKECGKHNLESVDLIAGGPPCQPFSLAGKRRGADDDRNLWPEMRRIIAELRPRWVLFENVAGIINIYAHVVASDLEALDYEVGVFTLPAAAFGAPHLRERLFIVAHANSSGQHKQGISVLPSSGRQSGRNVDSGGCGTTLADTAGIGCSWWEDISSTTISKWLTSLERNNPWSTEPNVGRVAYGVPHRVDRIRGLGNAVVPQVAELIGRIIYIVGQECGEW